MSWKLLGTPVGGVHRDRLDPYHWLARAFGDPCRDDFPVSIQMRDAGAVLNIAGLSCAPAHATGRFRTACATAAAYAALLKREDLVRVRDATPVAVQRPPRVPRQSDTPIPFNGEDERLSGNGPLLAIIDSGCPFAHADLRRSTGGTRIVRLWDQGSGAEFGGLGQPPESQGYGRELSGEQLDAAIDVTRDAHQHVDEDACYRRCGYWPVYGRTSHGAQSLGLMASKRRLNGRPNSILPPVQRQATAGTGARDGADTEAELHIDADIVFVQLPADVLSAISVATLEYHAYNAMRYIVETARTLGHDRVTVSFGFESWLGPHDGSSWFEQAIAALIEDAAKEHLRVDFVVAAGNAGDRAVHAHCSGSGPTMLTVQVPPDNEADTFVEIWADKDSPGLTVELAPPRGPSSGPISAGQACAWSTHDHGIAAAAIVSCGSRVLGSGGTLMVVRIGPTRTFDAERNAAPSGHWQLTISNGEVHAYIGRSENPPDGSRRGRQAAFVGLEKDSVGTLNGHAGGSGVQVAGAYLRQQHPNRRGRGQETPYSGRGPLRGGAARKLDWLVAVDDGILHTGSLCIGNRSAGVTRLSGTSVAAPLATRDLAHPVLRATHPGKRPRLIDPF